MDNEQIKNPIVRFPNYKSIVDKVFGAGNLDSFEYEEAESLVSLAKEELLKDLMNEAVEIEWESGTMKRGGKEVPFEGGKAKIIIVAFED